NKTDGTERISTIRLELQQAMESGAGIYRDEASLQATVDTIAELQQRVANVALDDHSLSFNTELTTALELEALLDIGEALAQSALQRTESRGSHQRTDHPERDDEHYLAHSLAYRDEDGGPPRIEYDDVTITKWPPGARVYGAASQPAGDGETAE
ncbi:MAG: succinate dehydrogenase/fumarate reductase flavoprotein subunit, partial [Dehalococcoidia bacterium]